MNHLSIAVEFLILFAIIFATFYLVFRANRDKRYRQAISLALGAIFLSLWVQGAVGIIGDSADPANLMYAAVLGIGVIGAALTRLRPLGMSRVVTTMAIAVALIAVITLVWNLGAPGPGKITVLAFHGVLVAIFLASAHLFRQVENKLPDVGAA